MVENLSEKFIAEFCKLMKNLIDEIMRIKKLSGLMIKENKDNSDWDTVYNWLKIFSTDNNSLLRTKNIGSGIWLKNALDNNVIEVSELDSVAKNNDGQVFSELPMVKNLLNK